MSWLSVLTTGWAIFVSTFTKDKCGRCFKVKLNVMYRARWDMKLCDQCWLWLYRAGKSTDKQREINGST